MQLPRQMIKIYIQKKLLFWYKKNHTISELLIIFPERTREQQIHINGYTTYLYNRGSGHIPQVAHQ